MDTQEKIYPVNIDDQTYRQLVLLETGLNAAASGIVITDIHGNIIWANAAFEKLTEYCQVEIIGKNPRDLVYSGKHPKGFYKNLWDTILSGQVWEGEIINRRKSGEFYTEEMSITPVLDAAGIISHFIAVKRDITERKKQELRQQALATLTSSLRHINTRAETIQSILDTLLELLDIEGAVFARHDTQTGQSIVEFSAGPAGIPFQGVQIADTNSIVGQVYETNYPYSSERVREDGSISRPDLLLDNVNALTCLKLDDRGYEVGVICVLGEKPVVNGNMLMLNVIADMASSAIQRVELFEQAQKRMERLAILRTIDLAISVNLDVNLIMNILVDQIVSKLPIDAVDILMVDANTQTLRHMASRGFATNIGLNANVRIGGGLAGKVAEYKRTTRIFKSDIANDNVDFLTLWEKEAFIEGVGVPLLLNDRVVGVLEFFNREEKGKEDEWFSFLETLAGQTVVAMENGRLFESSIKANEDLLKAYDLTIAGWSKAMDLRDRETEGHTRRVTEMTLILAKSFGFNAEQITQIRRGALLHDIGKLGIPDAILHKAGPLTENEWVLMRKHPVLAYEMLESIEYLQPALDIPYCHHEKWDGSGYPCGLKGEEIPLAARIFSVVDVYDALTSDRPYRKAWSQEKTLKYIREQAGIHFDPNIVPIFIAHVLQDSFSRE